MDDSLVEFKNDLVATHLSQAIFCMSKASYYHHSVQNKQFIISCIIHFNCAIESLVNLIGDDLLFDSTSKISIPNKSKDLPLKKFISAWGKSLSLEEKINFLCEKLCLKDINERLINEIKELNKLRNLVVHGKIYKTLYLQQNNHDDSYSILDVEHDIDSKKLFPNSKLNIPSELSINDCKIALRICLKSLLALSKVNNIMISYWLLNTKPETFAFIDNTKSYIEIEKIIIDQIN